LLTVRVMFPMVLRLSRRSPFSPNFFSRHAARPTLVPRDSLQRVAAEYRGDVPVQVGAVDTRRAERARSVGVRLEPALGVDLRLA